MLLKKLSVFLKNIFKAGIKWFLILIVPAILLSAIAFPFFAKIGVVECSTQYGVCSDKINQGLKAFVGKTIFTGSRGIKSYFSKDVFIKGLTVRFVFPDTIKVDLLIKKPSFCISADSPQKFALVDNQGIVLAISDNCALPRVLTKPASRVQGESVSESEFFSLKIVQGVYEMYQVATGKMDADLTVELASGVTVIFPVEGDSDALLGALRLIYTKIQKESLGKYKEIDLRFDSPVLR